MSSLLRRLNDIEPRIMSMAGHVNESVYGIVDRVDNINGELVPHFIRKWKGSIGNMRPTDEEPTIHLAEKLEPLILKHKKVKGAWGGRAGTKSIAVMDIMAGEVYGQGSGVFCLREKMKSLSQSIYKGVNSRINTLGFGGFIPVESKWKIDNVNGGIFSFGGMRNIEDMKSLFEFKFFLLEECANTSQEALDILGPTLRGVDGAEMWMIWNPKSSTDPMSTEFILPFQEDFDRQGYYEDDYHLLINIGYEDNPWFMHDQSLREEIAKDKQKVGQKRMSKSRFNHMWHGAFNDDIENSIIDGDWFDACIDAHEKLGFEGRGAVVAAHDPADEGKDNKGFAIRKGVVFYHMEELDAANANIAFDVACGIAKNHNVDVFGWDCDGMGALLRNQATVNFAGTKIETFMYKGSEGVHFPGAIFGDFANYGIKDAKTNKDVFKNKRAQNTIAIAERCRRTYEAVVHGIYHDPDTLISFSSEIPQTVRAKLRAEMCKMPLKLGDTIQLYSKQEMKKGILMSDGSRRKLPSPGLFDCVVLSFDNASIINKRNNFVMPRPIKAIGRR